MSTEQFKVRNVRCGGCVNAIRQGLGEIPGVSEVDVTIGSGEVTVRGEGLSRQNLSDKLKQLGYPEAA